MWSTDIEIRGLFCSFVEDSDLASFGSFCRDVSGYLPTKYLVLNEASMGGLTNVDSVVRRETMAEKTIRLLRLRKKPPVVFDNSKVFAICVEELYKFLQGSSSSSTIGICNFWIHDGDKFLGGIWSQDSRLVVESIPYWQKNLKVLNQESDENLKILVSKSCVHEIAESYGCRHHYASKGCVMDIYTNAFFRPELLCKDCLAILNHS
jgi:predicted Zn-dependent protease